MRTRRRILAAAIAVAVFSAIAWLLLSRPTEPVYEGQKLSYWLTQYAYSWNTDRVDQRNEAARVVREAGTNVIPVLLRMIQEKDSRFTEGLYQLFSKQRVIKNPIESAWEKSFLGAEGFEILGTNAAGAVPALINILENDESELVRARTAQALGGIGPTAKAAVPALVHSITNTNRPTNGPGIYALGEIHAEPNVVLPVLLNCMTNSDRYMHTAGIRAIGHFGPDAQQVIPALLVEATNPVSPVRSEVLRVLGQIRSKPEVVVPFLTGFLTNANPGLRSAAADGLGSFGLEATQAVPILLDLASDSNSYVRSSALEAMSRIDFQNEAVVRALGRGLHDTNFLVQSTAAQRLMGAGPFAKVAVPDLTNALRDQQPEIRVMAEAALKRIDPEAAAKAGVK